MRAYFVLTGAIFGFVALAHVVRLVAQLPIQVGEFQIPMWVSWGGVIVPGTLSICGLMASRRR
ncbi:MAG: hypothetical protein ABIJ37_10465 [Pseudomonadota bacterium]